MSLSRLGLSFDSMPRSGARAGRGARPSVNEGRRAAASVRAGEKRARLIKGAPCEWRQAVNRLRIGALEEAV